MAQPKHLKQSAKRAKKTKDAKATKAYVGDPRESSEIRRCRNTLSISGRAILVYLAWRFVKSFMVSALGSNSTKELDAKYFEDMFANMNYPFIGHIDLKVALLVFMAMLAFGFIEFFLYIYISRCALAQSRGEYRSGLYLLVARIVLAIDVIASLMVIPFVVFMSSIDEVLVTVIIDLTSFAMLFDLIRAGTKLRRLAGEGA